MENKLSPYNLGESRTANPRYASLRLKQLQLLVALGEHQSLRKVSEVLALSQPAATKSLQEVEEILGTTLFDRTSSGVSPNVFGTCAIKHAAMVLCTIDRMKSELDNLSIKNHQLIRIGTVAGTASEHFGEFLGRLASQDRFMVEVEEDTSKNLGQKLGLGKLDCILSKRLASLDEDNQIVRRIIHTSRICVVAGITHPLSADTKYTCSDLIQYDWIAYDHGSPISELLKSWFCTSIDRKPKIWMRTTSAFTTLSALNNSESLAMLPESVFLAMDNKSIKLIDTTVSSKIECCIYWRKDSLMAELISREYFSALEEGLLMTAKSA